MADSTALFGAARAHGRAGAGGWPAWVGHVRRHTAALAYAGAAVAIVLGWLGRDTRNLHAGEGLGYVLGIVGGVAMLVIPLYSVRKRLRSLEWLGPVRHWFRAHMGLGIFGPLVILYHCNFQLGDLNSRVALYCALLVAGSGIFGRYLYANIHMGLYGRRATLADRTRRLHEAPEQGQSALFRPVHEALAAVDREVLRDAGSATTTLGRQLAVTWQTRVLARRLGALIDRQLDGAAGGSVAIAGHRDRLARAAKRHVREHLGHVRAVALFGVYERAFHLWHVIHVPFLFMLILAATVHVIAVHLY